MFQTEIILFLQSFSSGFLDVFFKTITEVGRPLYSIPLLMILIFGCNYRFGFLLLHVAAWSGLITMGLKEIFSLPRPVHVDLNVQSLGENYANSTPFISRGAASFWGSLPREVVEYYRAYPPESWGFPSGHTSHAVTFWGAIGLYYKNSAVKILAGGLIVLIPLSRIYLGRHFLADVLGGYLLGAVFIAAFYLFVLRRYNLTVPDMSLRPVFKGFNAKLLFLIGYFFGVPWLVLLIPGLESQIAGAFLGFNGGFMLVWARGIPADKGTLLQRTARVLLAGGVLSLLYTGLKAASGIIFSAEPAAVAFLRHAATQFLVIWGVTELCFRLGLYQRNPA